jgi:hypothetical protein
MTGTGSGLGDAVRKGVGLVHVLSTMFPQHFPILTPRRELERPFAVTSMQPSTAPLEIKKAQQRTKESPAAASMKRSTATITEPEQVSRLLTLRRSVRTAPRRASSPVTLTLPLVLAQPTTAHTPRTLGTNWIRATILIWVRVDR